MNVLFLYCAIFAVAVDSPQTEIKVIYENREPARNVSVQIYRYNIWGHKTDIHDLQTNADGIAILHEPPSTQPGFFVQAIQDAATKSEERPIEWHLPATMPTLIIRHLGGSSAESQPPVMREEMAWCCIDPCYIDPCCGGCWVWDCCCDPCACDPCGMPCCCKGTPSTVGATTAVIDVALPKDSVVSIDGQCTTSTGGHRKYVSVGLEPGYRYGYVVCAQVTRNGRTFEEKHKVVLSAGGRTSISFDFTEEGLSHVVKSDRTEALPQAAFSLSYEGK